MQKHASPFCLTTLQKVEFPCFFKSSQSKALCHSFPTQDPKNLALPYKKKAAPSGTAPLQKQIFIDQSA